MSADLYTTNPTLAACSILLAAAWLWHKGSHDALALITALAAASFLLAPFVLRMKEW